MKCIKCGSKKNVDSRYEMCEECLRVDVFESLGRILAPDYNLDMSK